MLYGNDKKNGTIFFERRSAWVSNTTPNYLSYFEHVITRFSLTWDVGTNDQKKFMSK